MKTFFDYIFVEPFPTVWMIQDLIAIALSIYVLIIIFKREKRPAIVLLEAICFIFLYASIYENAAVVMGLYSYGRSLVMIGYIPASVPLLEACVMITGLWFLEKTSLPTWAKPPIIGLFGMLQDFSLDPLAIRQVFHMAGTETGRWNWLINPATTPNILHIPVFNFPGWMLIMLYGSGCLLVGRWWYKRSGYKTWVGYLYPFLSMIVALLFMISPISNFLLWLGPLFQKGSVAEWIMLGFHLIVPTALLIFLWRGRMTARFTREDLPIFIFPITLHLSDILFTLIGGYTEILWLVLLASAVQIGFLAFAYFANRRQFSPTPAPQYPVKHDSAISAIDFLLCRPCKESLNEV